MFDDLHEWYGRMLFGKSNECCCSRRACIMTLKHLILAYFYDFEHQKHFAKFLKNNTDIELINQSILFIYLLIKDKKEDKKFNKEKLKLLWQHPKFLQSSKLAAWFENSPLDEESTINLHLAYLRQCLAMDHIYNSDILELEKYVPGYPKESSECLLHLVRMQKSDRILGHVNTILKLLENEDDQVRKNCKAIMAHLQNDPVCSLR